MISNDSMKDKIYVYDVFTELHDSKNEQFRLLPNELYLYCFLYRNRSHDYITKINVESIHQSMPVKFKPSKATKNRVEIKNNLLSLRSRGIIHFDLEAESLYSKSGNYKSLDITFEKFTERKGYLQVRYMIVSPIDKNEQSYRGRMRKCNFKIAFNFQGNVKWLDAIVEGKTFSLQTGSIISLPDGTIFVTLQENADARDIQLNQRFYNTHQPFQVVGIARTQTGIVKLSCKLDSKSLPYDDVENNIADRWKYHLDATQMEKRKKHLF